MKQLRNIVAPIFLLCLMLVAGLPVFAQTQEDVTPQEQKENTVDVKEIVFGHIGDSYEWHITTWGKTHITIPLPIIVYSSTTGWHTFLSSRLVENGGTYEGLSVAPEGSKYEGKLVEYNAAGEQVRPWDISITKVTFALLFNSVLLLVIVLSVAQWYRKRPQGALAPGGLIILDDSDRVNTSRDYARAIAGLKAAGLLQVDFYGFCPMNCYAKCTSLFFSRDFAFEPVSPVQPVCGRGSLWAMSRRQRKEFYKKFG